MVQAAEKMDLLVVGAHRRSPVGRVIHGSVSMQLLEHAHVPVAVVPLTMGT
jgi:nucleotide-binding universal stress UspA family protein